MHETWQQLLSSWSWLSEVGNVNTSSQQAGCKGESLDAYDKDDRTTLQLPSGRAQYKVYVSPTMVDVVTRRQQDEVSGLPEHA